MPGVWEAETIAAPAPAPDLAPVPSPSPSHLASAADDAEDGVPWRQALGLDVKPVAPFSVRWGEKTADDQSWLRLRDPYTGTWHEIPAKGADKWFFAQLPGRQE